MEWKVIFCEDFYADFMDFTNDVQEQILAHSKLLERFGPQLGRPTVDTLYGSQISNMKELRFNTKNQVWRLAFAFDPERDAILLVAGNKAGKNEKRFYKALVKKAEERFHEYLSQKKEMT